METSPLVSVVIAVYNGGNLLIKSIDSILKQSYSNLEIILVNDGSTDDSSTVIRSVDDDRIKLLENGENRGLIYSLNYGIQQATGDVIVRMDADDIALPNRIKHQVEVLKRDPSLVAVGSWITLIDENDYPIGQWEYPETHTTIKWNQLFNSAMAHPSIMFLKSAFNKTDGYSVDYKYAEDYELWSRLGAVGKLYNIQAPLILYRVHSGSVSQSSNEAQCAVRQRISLENIRPYIGSKDVESDFLGKAAYTDSHIWNIENILLLRTKFIEAESPSHAEIKHIDSYILGLALNNNGKLNLKEKLSVAGNLIFSNLNLKVKCVYLIKSILSYLKGS